MTSYEYKWLRLTFDQEQDDYFEVTDEFEGATSKLRSQQQMRELI